MFEGVVAAVLNRFLGKYVQDLDTENLNVGIFGGDVQLHNLRIRPEALVSIALSVHSPGLCTLLYITMQDFKHA